MAGKDQGRDWFTRLLDEIQPLVNLIWLIGGFLFLTIKCGMIGN